MYHYVTNFLGNLPGGRPPGQARPDLAEPTPGASVYAGSIIINLFALALPLTVLQIYDRVLPNASFDTLVVMIGALIVVVILDGILKYCRSFLINWASASFTHNLSTKALGVMMAATPSRHAAVSASEHLDRLNSISGLGGYLGGQSRVILVDICFIPIFAGIIILLGGPLFLVPLLLFALFGYYAMQRTKHLCATIEEREKSDSRKYDFVIEILQSMQTVKSLAMEPQMMRRFERLQSAESVLVRRLIKLTGAAQNTSALYASMSAVTIVGAGAFLVLAGQMTIGGLACSMLLSSQLLQPIMRSLSAWNEIHLADHRRDRIAEIFDPDQTTLAENQNKQEFRYPERLRAEAVSLKGVTIQYGDAQPIFDQVDFNAAAGALIALKGVDGSGRTSLLRAIAGDITPSAGEIRIGGKLVNDKDGNATSASIRYVEQKPTTFKGTILENLTLFGALPTPSALWASRLIGLDKEIVRMPLGYDTPLRSLSGRGIPASTAQRICIARALATKPSVLILDEANTSLDMPSEKEFAAALRQLHGQITIIIATHRPSLIRLADESYEVANGSLTRHTSAPSRKAAG
ncbi:MAG: ATP-binding cassette domain-containing protein [Alphaproteobacteria bacterium]|nr:ATP-binding cassette domain-containing protein [Alphaproteobacteria bacterium]